MFNLTDLVLFCSLAAVVGSLLTLAALSRVER